MDKSFGRSLETPTSSATEAGFNVMKNKVFRGVGCVRVDSWLERHLKFLQGKSLTDKSNFDIIGDDFDDGQLCEDDIIIEQHSDCDLENYVQND